MNGKLAILLSVMLASGTAFAQTDPVGGETGTGDMGAMDQGVTGGAADQGAMDQGVTGGTADQGATDQDISGGTADQSVPGSQQQEASFSQADTNADGLISEDEAQGSIADNFDQADANADGYVNRSEYNTLLGEQTLQE